jgi:hypothetical protein
VLFAEARKGSEGEAAAVEELGAIDPKALVTVAAAAGTETKTAAAAQKARNQELSRVLIADITDERASVRHDRLIVCLVSSVDAESSHSWTIESPIGNSDPRMPASLYCLGHGQL